MKQRDRLPLWVHSVAWGGLLILILILLLVGDRYRGQGFWQAWVESLEFRNPGYSERIHPNDLFRTRANTWSNLAYVLVGFYSLALAFHDRQHSGSVEGNYLVCTPAMSLLFGVACCYLGLGSGLFHASLTRWGQQLDVGSMYAPLLACIAINVGRYCPSHFRMSSGNRIPVWTLLASLVVLGAYLLYHYKWSMSSGQVLPIHILIVVVFALVDCIPNRSKIDPRTLNRRWLFVGMVALVLAVLFRQLDVARKFGTPESAIQGHALWHLLTALALGSMYLYYRSEHCDSPGLADTGGEP